MRTTVALGRPRAGLLFTCAVLLAVVAARPAEANKISYQSPSELKQTCMEAGGDYFAPNSNGVYACYLGGGRLISCGGKGKHAKTCDNDGKPARTGASTGAGTWQSQAWIGGAMSGSSAVTPRGATLK